MTQPNNPSDPATAADLKRLLHRQFWHFTGATAFMLALLIMGGLAIG